MTRFGNDPRLLAFAALALLTVSGCGGDDNGEDPTGMTTLPTITADGDGNGDGQTTATTSGNGASSDNNGPTTAGPTADGPGDSDTDAPDDDTTDGELPPSPSCQHRCTTPQDCFVNGEETGLGCNASVCSIACTDGPECVAVASGWTLIPCASTAECSEGGGVCVDVGDGTGGCSLQPSQGACSDAGLVEMMATSIEGAAITVCGQPNAICTPWGAMNVCIIDCIGNPCGGNLTCESDGLCHCAFDTQCVDVGLGNNCNADGLCEFACQAADGCPPHPFDGGQTVCQ
ncbi:MAG: hypothetical protein JKY37_31460 [Nannocystaceae bacterium]|nr:hypothetical protein [Nannocystaceae bacterium]